MFVEYRDLTEFPGYRVGSDGSVWSRRDFNGGIGGQWSRLSDRPTKKGYVKVGLRKDGRYAVIEAHALILRAFIGPCPPGMEACHENGVKWENRLENLRWDTHANNQRDNARLGVATNRRRAP